MSDHYTYRFTWSAEDGEHVGLCTEFPSLSWLVATPGEALSGIQRLVADCVDDMRANDEPVPEPMADRTYSGKFMVRVPPETHRALAIRAAEQGVSMNRLVSARLAKEGLNKRAGDPVLAPGEVDELPGPLESVQQHDDGRARRGLRRSAALLVPCPPPVQMAREDLVKVDLAHPLGSEPHG